MVFNWFLRLPAHPRPHVVSLSFETLSSEAIASLYIPTYSYLLVSKRTVSILVPRAILVTIRLAISHRSALWGAGADITKFTQRAFDANVTSSSSDASDGAMITQAVGAILTELLDCLAVRSCHRD